MPRGIGANEYREALLTADEERQLAEKQAEQGPSQAQLDAGRMIVDAFGMKGTESSGPAMRQLHGQFTKVRERVGVRVNRATERLPSSELPRSNGRFVMDRAWDREDDK